MALNVLLLLTVTSIWGFGFIATRWSLSGLDPYWVNALRFSLAGLASLPFLFYKKSFTRKDNILKKSFISSIFLLGILLFQTIGLGLTTVAKSGFITTLYTFFIPIITIVLFKKKYRPTFWLLIFMAMSGMALMCNLEIKDLNLGDFFTFICSICAAFHIIYIGMVVNTIDSPIEFNFLQNFFVALLSIPIALFFKGMVNIDAVMASPDVLLGIFYLGIISSMISFTAQIIAQKKIPDHIAGLIFLTESPFAAFFGYMIFKEKLTEMNLYGAGLIILAVCLVPILGREVTASVKTHGHSH
ncbi:MAG: DMT family transporter [Bacteriovoracaceae bacterium]|nr:DMT family transporter [Bacteriovoracaceae bacterium]